MAVEIRIVEITFDPKNYRGGNINQVEKQLAQLIDQGWRIVASGGTGMGYGYGNADYRSYGNEEMGRYGYSLTGFVILQREKPKRKPSQKQSGQSSQATQKSKPSQKLSRQLPKDVQETMLKIKSLSNKPKKKPALQNHLKYCNLSADADKIIQALQSKGYISKDGTIDYDKI